MLRGRTLVWTIIGGVVAAVAVVIALMHSSSGSPSKAASPPAPPISGTASTQSSESAPVVTAEASGTYLSDLKPSGDLSELVNPGPVKISGSIYPKSLSFYCNVGDPTPFPEYRLKHNARRFQATIGLATGSPSAFEGDVMLIGDGHTLRTFGVSVQKPKTVDVGVQGVHTLKLECFGSGNSATGGEAVGVEWGNARVSAGR